MVPLTAAGCLVYPILSLDLGSQVCSLQKQFCVQVKAVPKAALISASRSREGIAQELNWKLIQGLKLQSMGFLKIKHKLKQIS